MRFSFVALAISATAALAVPTSPLPPDLPAQVALTFYGPWKPVTVEPVLTNADPNIDEWQSLNPPLYGVERVSTVKDLGCHYAAGAQGGALVSDAQCDGSPNCDYMVFNPPATIARMRCCKAELNCPFYPGW